MAVQDAAGNTIINDNTTQITLAIDNNPSGGVLAGNTTVTIKNGVAEFTGLHIYKTGSGYILETTSDPIYTPTTSTAFNITSPPGIPEEEWITRRNGDDDLYD